jgi:acyl carrier protein
MNRIVEAPAVAAEAAKPDIGGHAPAHEEVLERIRATLVELFDLPPERIRAEARLYEDLEIDSIDVVDLMDEVQRHTGRKVTPDDFRSVRTVGDLARVMQRLLNGG